MSIVGKRPTVPLEGIRTLDLDKTGYKTVAADNNDIRIKSLQAYADGLPWKIVAYYAQYLGKDNQIRELDVELSAPHQQYVKINDAELRVQSDLSTNFNSEEKVTTTTGSALVLHIVPNEYDYFIAESGIRRLGLYRITGIERRTLDDDSVYSIEYQLDSYLGTYNQKADNLESKVIKEFTYSRERLIEGLSPVIRTKDHEDLINIDSLIEHYQKRMRHMFVDRATYLLGVPGQVNRVYDSNHTKFLRAIIGLGTDECFLEVKSVSFDNDTHMELDNLYTALLTKDYESISYCINKYSLVPKRSFSKNSWLRGPLFWPVDYYMYPVLEGTIYKDTYGEKPKVAVYSLDRSFESEYDSSTPIPSLFLEPWNYLEIDNEDVELIKPVMYDGYYVFSQSFYNKGEDLSILELLTRDYLKNYSVNLNYLKALTDSWDKWPNLEKFYYTPILIFLLKEAKSHYTR